MQRQENGGMMNMNRMTFFFSTDSRSVVSFTSQIILDVSLLLVCYCFLNRQRPGLFVNLIGFFFFLSVSLSHTHPDLNIKQI